MDVWHTQPVEETFKVLKTGSAGLSSTEAARRLREGGPNTLPEARQEGIATIFLRQFESPLIYVLFGASVIVFAMGEWIDGSIILAVLLFNAIAGTFQEGRAQNTLRALKTFVATNATVVRDGEEMIVKDTEVVEGDVISLQEGEKVPADARVILAHSLRIDEASLTGESEPVTKSNEVLRNSELATADQKNMVFKGTYVLAGNGKAVAVETGAGTVIGKI